MMTHSGRTCVSARNAEVDVSGQTHRSAPTASLVEKKTKKKEKNPLVSSSLCVEYPTIPLTRTTLCVLWLCVERTWYSAKCAPSAGSAENPPQEQPHLSPYKNNCYSPLTTVIVRCLRQPFLKNPAELTTLNDIGPADFH